MRIFPFFLFLLLITSCSNTEPTGSLEKNIGIPDQIDSPEFQWIIDSAKVKGAILILDDFANTYYSNDFDWVQKGQLPASTFKIPNSLIALETGVVKSDSTLFKWDGQARWSKIWEQDLIFKDAFQLSCVPCYQEVARKIGHERMNDYLDRFDYGQMKVDSSNIDMFWLEGDSRISPMEQIDFLKRFYNAELPISRRTEQLMKRMMILDTQKGYTLSGKTGWSTSEQIDNGWFVGFVEKGERIYYFSTNISPAPELDMGQFSGLRKEITYEAFRQLELIP